MNSVKAMRLAAELVAEMNTRGLAGGYGTITPGAFKNLECRGLAFVIRVELIERMAELVRLRVMTGTAEPEDEEGDVVVTSTETTVVGTNGQGKKKKKRHSEEVSEDVVLDIAEFVEEGSVQAAQEDDQVVFVEEIQRPAVVDHDDRRRSGKKSKKTKR